MTETSYCRLCAELISTENSIALIDSVDCKQNLIYKIYECFHIQIQLSDNLPKFVCSECYKQVLNTFEFSEKIRRGQDVLTGLFNQLDDKNIKLEWNDNVDPLQEGENKVFVKNEQSSNEDEDFDYGTAGNFCTVKNEPLSDDESTGVSNSSITVKRETKSGSRSRIQQKLQENEEWKKYRWICNACQCVLESMKELRDHYDRRHGTPVQYTCVDCYKLFSLFDTFRKHVRRHWNKHRYQCHICEKYFADKTPLKMHMVVHSDERKFMCSTCGESFKTEKTLTIHNRIHFPDDQKLECDICQKTFSTLIYLTKHKKRHEGLRPCTCEQCGMTFSQKSGLDKHIMCAHTDQTPVQCPHCPRILKNDFSFRRHEKEHTAIKPHECIACGKKFRLRSQLKEHSKIHSGEFPFECEHCKKSFRAKKNLKMHLRQHTGERPFSCLECHRAFSDTSNFSKHLKTRHGLEKVSLVNQRQYPFPTNDSDNTSAQSSSRLF